LTVSVEGRLTTMEEREKNHRLSSEDAVEGGDLDDSDTDESGDEESGIDVEGAKSIARDEP
jgi:hypothetical protein